MQVLIMSGGTGGHVYPALAVAQEFLKAGDKVSWMGTEAGLEARVIPANNIEIDWVDIKGLRQNGVLGWILAPFKLIRAVIQSIGIINARSPQVVLGMGGFVAGPGGVAAKLTRTPLVIHEQNAIAGLTNKILARVANKVLEAFPGTFPKHIKARAAGNPVRPEIENIQPKAITLDKLNVLVVGGSLGAQRLNEILPEALSRFEADEIPNIWHQTGRGKLDTTIRDYKTNNLVILDNKSELTNGEVYLAEYIEDMAEGYTWADVVICRAGAMTVFEIAASARPALFIPFPYAVDDHQTHNANYLVAAGGAELIQQAELDAGKLYAIIKSWMAGPAKLTTMANIAHSKYIKNSAATVRKICQEAAKP